MMASTSTADLQVGHEGGQRENTELEQFTDQHDDDDEEQEAVFPVCKLQRPDSIHSSRGMADQEKPFFVNSPIVPGRCESLVLSGSGVAVPYTISRYLRNYQREGVQFIYDNYAQSRGCILGDDMGLGKTVQVIGFLAAVLGKTGTWKDIENNRPQFLLTQIIPEQNKPQKVFLIVAPLSVLYNWKAELETWGHFRSVVVHGLRKEEDLARVRRGRTEIALTTYETLRLSLEQFNSINWSAVIVDEAHKIKNPNSQITVAMKELRCRVRVGLTGTILQNNLEELWCVMDWANPRCLGTLGNFKNTFSEPIELAQKHSATKRALAKGRRAVRALARELSHWFLRRTKSLIKEQLPRKDDRVVYCSLTSFQQAVYQEVLDTEDVRLLLRSSEMCDCHSRRPRRRCCYKVNSKGVRVSDLYFSYMAILRKVANHVALLQSTGTTSKTQEQYAAAVCKKVFQKFPDFTERCKQASFEAMSDPMYSGKMKVLQKLLKHYMQRNDKMLLFSLSTKLLDVLESYCVAEGLEYSRLDGNTKSSERLKIVNDFNSSPDINLCLVSTMAGGLGLNFVGANVVILFDPTWNPANDLQAIDRVYRIGQCRDVTVLRLISLGTVEEVVYLRQVYKQQLQCSVVGNQNARRYFEAVQGADCQKGELFGIQNLFRLQTQGTCLTRRILQREGRVEVGVMTANTHTGVEEEETKEDRRRRRESEVGNISSEDPCDPSNGGVNRVVRTSATPRGPPRRILDFSSEEDEEGSCWRKVEGTVNTSAPPGHLSLYQHGFSRLLQRSGVRAGSGESSQSEGGVGDSEEDEDVGVNVEGLPEPQRRPHGQLRRRETGMDSGLTSNRPHPAMRDRHTENIETFTSSDEEHSPAKRGRPQTDGPRAFTLTGLKSQKGNQAVPSAEERLDGTIDNVLGGMQEVVDTHSNQHVVGGSKAEERISRAALRDVFELHKYSQFPANELVVTQETQPDSAGGAGWVQAERGAEQSPLVHRPVTHTSTSVHRPDRHNIVIIGQTPRAVRRKQLEDMACKFGFSSLRRFAEEVLRSTSAQRQSQLRQFYIEQSPELASVVMDHFPEPHTAQPKPVRRDSKPYTKTKLRPSFEDNQEAALEPQTEPRTLHRAVPEPQWDIPSLERKELRFQNTRGGRKKRICEGGTSSAAQHFSPDPADSPPSRRRSVTLSVSSSSSALSLHPQPGPSPSPQGGWSGLLTSHRKGEAVEKQRTSAQAFHPPPLPPSPQVLLTELLGDTSILDDLLRPRSKASSDTQGGTTRHSMSTASPSTKPRAPPKLLCASPAGTLASPTTAPHASSPPPGRSRGRRRDFWDILEEGNEERINQLTDLSEVERVCETSCVTARAGGAGEGGPEEESMSLWKTNHKFLWKK